MKVIIGSDHNGLALKEVIKAHLAALGHACDDVGTHDSVAIDYPDVARQVAEDIAAGLHARGILICGTGIGMAIAANKVPGVRAAQAHDVYSAERARRSNNAQIITLGAAVVGPELAKSLVTVWLEAEFDGGRSAAKVNKIEALDAHYRLAREAVSSAERIGNDD